MDRLKILCIMYCNIRNTFLGISNQKRLRFLNNIHLIICNLRKKVNFREVSL